MERAATPCPMRRGEGDEKSFIVAIVLLGMGGFATVAISAEDLAAAVKERRHLIKEVVAPAAKLGGRCLPSDGTWALRGVSFLTQHPRRHCPGNGIRWRQEPRREGHRPQYHAERRRHRRLERGRYCLPPRDGEHARFRCDRREYGSCTGEYGEAHTRGPQSHRCVYQVAAAPARRCPQVRTEKERGKDQRVRK